MNTDNPVPEANAKPPRISQSLSGRSFSQKKKARPFLSSSQLSDLFNRLDKNGDGELDLEEFTGIIKVLKLDVEEDYIADVFRSVDTAASGTLEMREFICAYQKIYNHASVNSSSKTRQEFVRATRYGSDENNKNVFELYILSEEKGNKSGKCHIFNVGQGSSKKNDGLPSLFHECKTEDFNGDLNDIRKMIYADSERNAAQNCRLLWWVDISLGSIERSAVTKYVETFGLPNHTKFLSNFGNFGSVLPKDPKSRVFVGQGVVETGNVTSMSVFTQTAVLKNRPIVHLWVSPIERSISADSFGLVRSLTNYYQTRFAFMLNLSSYTHTHRNDKHALFEAAEIVARRLRDDSSFLEEDQASAKKGENEYSIMNSCGKGVPLTQTDFHQTPPTWVSSNTQLLQKPPSVKIDTLGLHVLNYGNGSNCLLTIRRIDDEKNANYSLEEKSRCGVLGRILDGVWVKLLELTVAGGISDAGGEMDDSPGTLMTFMMMLVHSYSMTSLGSVDHWINCVEKEIRDMVVSKHSAHLAEMERIVKEFSSYVNPYHDMLSKFLDECEAEADVENEETEEVSAVDKRKSSRRSIIRVGNLGGGKDKNGQATDISKLSISSKLLKSFYNNPDSFYRDLCIIVEGYEPLEMKGLHYWKDRLDRYSQRLTDVRELIASQLDEKRNFTSFLLTIVTTLLAPLAILTGYFGMNFDNMEELNSNTYPSAPGVKLLWIIAGVSYGLMLLLSIHWRVIYSAT